MLDIKKWCEDHDWCDTAFVSCGLIFVRDSEMVMWKFNTLTELKSWAGY